MDVIYLLLSVSILVAIAFLMAFIWSVRNGQYDDIVSPSVRILYDQKNNTQKEETVITQNNKPDNNNDYGKQHRKN
jgi:cbb3-type cytochrome oxidase maturation protein